MNSDDFAFFRLVVDAGSVAAAAISAGCDASTISRRITGLERAVGARLFVRSGRGLTISPEGEVLLDYAQQVAGLISKAKSSISTLRKQGPSLIHIVAQPTIARTLFGRLYHAIGGKFPNAQVHFSEALADEILMNLRNSNVDIALMYRPEFPGQLSYEPLLYERLYLITPVGYVLPQGPLLSKAFGQIPLILKSTHHGSRVFIEELCARLGCEPRIVLQNDSSIAITVELIAQNCGCAILPLAAAQPFIEAGRVAAHPLDGQEFERCVALTVGRTEISSSDVHVLNGLIRDIVADLTGTKAWPGTRSVA